MRARCLLFSLGFLPLLLGTHAVRAQATLRSMDALDLAWQLAAYGRLAHAPLALAAAAQLVLDNRPQPLNGASQDSSFDAAGWLAEAARLARNDSILHKLVAAIQGAPRMRGAADGPRAGSYPLTAGGSQEVLIRFVPASPAAIRVHAPAGARVNCLVIGARGERIAEDQGGSSCFLNFTPSDANAVRLTVKNVGDSPIRYILITN